MPTGGGGYERCATIQVSPSESRTTRRLQEEPLCIHSASVYLPTLPCWPAPKEALWTNRPGPPSAPLLLFLLVAAGATSGCGGADPQEGDWEMGALMVARSTCGALTDDVDEDPALHLTLARVDGGFTLSQAETAWTCTQADQGFTCDAQTLPFDDEDDDDEDDDEDDDDEDDDDDDDDDDDEDDDEDALLSQVRALSGRFASATQGTLEIRDAWSCEGAGCALYEEWFGASLPCETHGTSTMTFGGATDSGAPTGALAYAQECEEQLGPVPGFDCADGVQVPITVDGLEVNEDQPAGSCDAPSIAEGDCNVGTRVGRLAGADETVVWGYLCRKYDGIVQLIGHDTETGATCFFESNWDVAERSDQLSLSDGIVVGPVPGPADPDYAAVWKPPAEVASQRCWSCHLADPYVHTPYVDGARLPADPAKPVIPEVGGPDQPYFLVGDAFQAELPGGSDGGLATLHIDGNGCLDCHRFSDPRSFSFDGGPTYDADVYMPPDDPGSLSADLLALLACADAGPANTPGCELRPFPAAPSTSATGCGAAMSVTRARSAFAVLAVLFLAAASRPRRRLNSAQGREGQCPTTGIPQTLDGREPNRRPASHQPSPPRTGGAWTPTNLRCRGFRLTERGIRRLRSPHMSRRGAPPGEPALAPGCHSGPRLGANMER